MLPDYPFQLLPNLEVALFKVRESGLIDKGVGRSGGQTSLPCVITPTAGQDGIPLREVPVRTVRPYEEPRWKDLMREQHYLGFRNFRGNRLR